MLYEEWMYVLHVLYQVPGSVLYVFYTLYVMYCATVYVSTAASLTCGVPF